MTQASARLRLVAKRCGKNIDVMIADDEDYELAVKGVVVQAVCRALDNIGSGSNVQRGSESIGAFSMSMTYLNAGQSLYFLRSELKELGLTRQRYGLLDIFGFDSWEALEMVRATTQNPAIQKGIDAVYALNADTILREQIRQREKAMRDYENDMAVVRSEERNNIVENMRRNGFTEEQIRLALGEAYDD